MSKLLYAKTHEWIQVEGNKGKIGISEFAAKAMGDIVFVELPSVGAKVAAGKALCNVESVKAVSECFSPASGTIVAVNTELEDNPGKINEAALDAWIVEIEIDGLGDGLSETETIEE